MGMPPSRTLGECLDIKSVFHHDHGNAKHERKQYGLCTWNEVVSDTR